MQSKIFLTYESSVIVKQIFNIYHSIILPAKLALPDGNIIIEFTSKVMFLRG